MLRWMFWEQYNHEPNVATLRFWFALLGEENLSDVQRTRCCRASIAAGEAALTLMDEHLARKRRSVGGSMTLADIALYAYTHVADDGGFGSAAIPTCAGWLADVAAQPATYRR